MREQNLTTMYEQLTKMIGEDKVLLQQPLMHYTFTKTGGHADLHVFPCSYEDVQAVIRLATAHNMPLTTLGNGSNIIIRDGGIRGVVINLTKLDNMKFKGERLVVQSGAALIGASRFALEHHMTGLEFACGIPGTVGGAVYMNAGAYGGEVADVLDSVLVAAPDGELLRLSKEQLELAYRHSNISEKGYIVLEAVFLLKQGDFAEIKQKMDELTYLRESKQPLEYPSCGSVFKRPPGHFAGKLIQDSGLQGFQIGGVQVSTKHAGFMVNVDGGTATDYIQLIKHVQTVVEQNFGVRLETEVKILGEDA